MQRRLSAGLYMAIRAGGVPSQLIRHIYLIGYKWNVGLKVGTQGERRMDRHINWRTNRTFIISMILLIAILVFPRMVHSGEVELQLNSVKSEYVVGEPLKFTVRLINNTDETIYIPAARYFDMNMWFFLIEIITPDSTVEFRKFQYQFEDGASIPKYTSEPLAPGASIETNLYPNITFLVDISTLRKFRGEMTRTFPDPSEYRIRLIYVIRRNVGSLWRDEDGLLYSNDIKIKFKEPDSAGEEILGALWAKGGRILSIGDDNILFSFDEMALEEVIAKYPDHFLTKYARFYLAKSYLVKKKDPEYDQMEEGVTVLEALQREYPEFRPMEVRQLIATGYFRTNREEEARRLFKETLELYPALKDNYQFMKQKIYADTKSFKAVADWHKQRSKGATPK